MPIPQVPPGRQPILEFLSWGSLPAGPFDLPFEDVAAWLSTPNPHGRPSSDVLRPYLNGKDLNQRSRGQWTIDFTGMEKNSAALYEAPFAHVNTSVRPAREQNNRDSYRLRWWLYAEARDGMRSAMHGLDRYIATCRVAKHRVFSFVSPSVLPDSATIVFARSDDFFFGVLHSRFHEVWSLAQGTQLEDRPRYTPTTCFETFPFPWDHRLPVSSLDAGQQVHHERISRAARSLDELRNRWLNPPEWTREEILEFPASPGGPWDRFIEPSTVSTLHSPMPVARYPRIVPRDADCAKKLADRTLTKLYNARPAWLAAAHDELDSAVAAAYGFPADLPASEILLRLLNRAVLKIEFRKKACTF